VLLDAGHPRFAVRGRRGFAPIGERQATDRNGDQRAKKPVNLHIQSSCALRALSALETGVRAGEDLRPPPNTMDRFQRGAHAAESVPL
jgi:hypothetical protein